MDRKLTHTEAAEANAFLMIMNDKSGRSTAFQESSGSLEEASTIAKSKSYRSRPYSRSRPHLGVPQVLKSDIKSHHAYEFDDDVEMGDIIHETETPAPAPTSRQIPPKQGARAASEEWEQTNSDDEAETSLGWRRSQPTKRARIAASRSAAPLSRQPVANVGKTSPATSAKDKKKALSMTAGAIDSRKRMEMQRQYEARLKELVGAEILEEGEDEKGTTPGTRLIKAAVKALEMEREKTVRLQEKLNSIVKMALE